jgi:hypothetical protein
VKHHLEAQSHKLSKPISWSISEFSLSNTKT